MPKKAKEGDSMSLRDYRIDYIESRGKHLSGAGIGVILLDETYPAYPGDVRNPSAFPYPIQYEIAEGLTIQRLMREGDKDQWLPCIQDAARKLEKWGCRAIIAECGYFAYFQKQIAATVKVPVFLSSLLQVPWAQTVIAPDQVVGILCADTEFLEDKHLEGVGIRPGSNYVTRGASDNGNCPEHSLLWDARNREGGPRCHYRQSEIEFVEQATKFYEDHPNMGAMVFECTGFPPYAREVQRLLNIPIFTWSTLMDFAYSVTVHRDFYGHV